MLRQRKAGDYDVAISSSFLGRVSPDRTRRYDGISGGFVLVVDLNQIALLEEFLNHGATHTTSANEANSFLIAHNNLSNHAKLWVERFVLLT
ncbi:hypothetical protein D3C84_1096870 [compost metagenome]